MFRGPNYDGPDPTVLACDEAAEFVQPIGVIYYWLVRSLGLWSSCSPREFLDFILLGKTTLVVHRKFRPFFFGRSTREVRLRLATRTV